MKTLEEYLRQELVKGVRDHKIGLRLTKVGEVIFYIHPDGVDGSTLDFLVYGNELKKCGNLLPE